MEIAHCYEIAACVTALFAAVFLFLGSSQYVFRAKQKDSFAASYREKGLIGFYVRNGIRVLERPAAFILRNVHIALFFVRLEWALTNKGYKTTKIALCSLFCLLLPLVFVLACLLGGSWIVACCVVIAVLASILFSIGRLNEKRDKEIREAVPDALRAMSDCSHAGLSLPQTFQQISKETEGQLQTLFHKIVSDLEAGRTMKEALERFQRSSNVSELAFIAVALDVQYRTGGSLKQVLDAARDSVESELELKRKLRVQTAQAKLSARIVTIMPFFLVTIFSFLSPGYLEPFFQSIEGLVLLAIAVCMQVGGILLVRQMLAIRVK